MVTKIEKLQTLIMESYWDLTNYIVLTITPTALSTPESDTRTYFLNIYHINQILSTHIMPYCPFIEFWFAMHIFPVSNYLVLDYILGYFMIENNF